MTVTTFSELELDESLLQALQEKGFTRPTVIQAAAIPPALEGVTFWVRHLQGPGKPPRICYRRCSTSLIFRVRNLARHAS